MIYTNTFSKHGNKDDFIHLEMEYRNQHLNNLLISMNGHRHSRLNHLNNFNLKYYHHNLFLLKVRL
jgi:hypothetical protein